MTHPAVVAILVGVAIGTAIYYYLNNEQIPQTHQYRAGDSHGSYEDYSRNSNNNPSSSG